MPPAAPVSETRLRDELGDLEQHRRAVRKLALRMLGNAADAEDATQEAFARAFMSRPQGVESFRGYLYTVARNLCLDFQRARRVRRGTRSIDAELGEDGATLHDLVGAPASQEHRVELSEAREAIERLPARERQIVLRRAVGHLVEDIAADLGLSQCYVSQIHGEVTDGGAIAQPKRRETYEVAPAQPQPTEKPDADPAPAKPKRRPLTEIAREAGISYGALQQRLRAGWTMDEALAGERAGAGITFNGKTQSLAAWSRELGINTGTLHSRLRDYGWSVERAFTTPARAP
jgi:RNA polymerase sigma-70 factor (ECF subfamily)